MQEAMNLPMGSDDAQSVNPLQLTNEQQSRALQSTNQQNLGCYGMVGSTKGYLTSSDDRIYSSSDLQNTHNNLLFNQSNNFQVHGQMEPQQQVQNYPAAWRQSSELQNHTEMPQSQLMGPNSSSYIAQDQSDESQQKIAAQMPQNLDFNMAASIQNESQLHREMNMMQGTLGVSDTSQVLMLSQSRKDNMHGQMNMTTALQTYQTTGSMQ